MTLHFQTDTLVPDSNTVRLSADTLKSIQPNVASPSDSVSSTKKKDSTIIVKSEQKTAVKVNKTDSISIKKQVDIFPDTSVQVLPDIALTEDSALKSDSAATHFGSDFLYKGMSYISAEKGNQSKNNLQLKSREDSRNDWALLLFFIVFSLLAWLKVAYARRVKQLFSAFINSRYIRQLVREEFVFSHPTSIVLTLVFLFSFSLLLTQANNYFYWKIFGGSFILIFFKFFISLIIFYLLKIVLIRISGILFSVGEEITEYLFNLVLFNSILGLLLLPFTMGILYANAIAPRAIITVAGAIILFSFLFRLVKVVYVGMSATKFSLYYIILYICALEVLPLLIAIKTFGY